jgi:MFS transporter, DHA2 family, multidrug resistance protein
VIFSVMSLLAPFLQDLMHYSVLQAGYLLSSRSIGTSVSMMLVGRLMAWIDARLLIAAGLVLAAFSLWQMTQYNLLMDQWPIMLPGVIMGFGLGSAMVPSTAMCFATLARSDFNEATSLYALVRNMGNSIGIAMMQGLLVHNMQIAHSSLAAHITPFTRSFSNPAGAVIRSPGMLNQLVTTQAQLIAYIDDFKFLLVTLLACLPLLLFVRRPETSKGAITEVAAE